jgi:hypothetical protein
MFFNKINTKISYHPFRLRVKINVHFVVSNDVMNWKYLRLSANFNIKLIIKKQGHISVKMLDRVTSSCLQVGLWWWTSVQSFENIWGGTQTYISDYADADARVTWIIICTYSDRTKNMSTLAILRGSPWWSGKFSQMDPLPLTRVCSFEFYDVL